MNNILSLRFVVHRPSNQELIFRGGEISFFTHATEDLEKILETISMRFDIPIEIFEKRKGEGHFGNPIEISKAHLGQAESEALVKMIVRGIGMDDRAILAKEIDNHLDSDGTLYLRLDKQELLLGNLILAERDTIRIKVKLKSPRKGLELIVQGYKKLLLE